MNNLFMMSWIILRAICKSLQLFVPITANLDVWSVIKRTYHLTFFNRWRVIRSTFLRICAEVLHVSWREPNDRSSRVVRNHHGAITTVRLTIFVPKEMGGVKTNNTGADFVANDPFIRVEMFESNSNQQIFIKTTFLSICFSQKRLLRC